MSFPADLPDDTDALKAILAAAEAQISAQNQTLTERDGIIERKEDRIIRLEKLLADFSRSRSAPVRRSDHHYSNRRSVDCDRVLQNT